jgi:hypothetical protein
LRNTSYRWACRYRGTQKKKTANLSIEAHSQKNVSESTATVVGHVLFLLARSCKKDRSYHWANAEIKTIVPRRFFPHGFPSEPLPGKPLVWGQNRNLRGQNLWKFSMWTITMFNR